MGMHGLCQVGVRQRIGAELIRTAIGLVLTLALFALVSSSAVAVKNANLKIVLHNETGGTAPAAVTLVQARGQDCWDSKDLDHGLNTRYVYPKAWSNSTTLTYTTVLKQGVFSCFSGGVRGIDLMVRDSKVDQPGSWYVPSGTPGDYQVKAIPSGEHVPTGFAFLHTLPTWVPRKDGYGLICWHTTTTSPPLNGLNFGDGTADIWVYNDYAHCNVAARADVYNGDKLPTPITTTVDETATGPPPAIESPVAELRGSSAPTTQLVTGAAAQIVDLLSTIGVACPWYVFKNDNNKCNGTGVSDASRWSVDNVSHNIQDFKVTEGVGALDDREGVGANSLTVPTGSPSGTVTVSEGVTNSVSNTTSTQTGFKVGQKIGFKESFKAGLSFLADGKIESSQEVSGEQNWSTTDSQTKGDSKTRTVTISVGAAPGYYTRLEVFTTKRNSNYLYAANLDMGTEDKDQNVTTPAPLALDQSPSSRQPCLESTIGSKKVRNSITYVGQQLFDAGYTPTESSIRPEQRAFLASISSFSWGGTCPGFPSEFASTAAFHGTGVGTYADKGYGPDGKPTTEYVGCVYRTELPSDAAPPQGRLQSPTASAGGDFPCHSYSPEGRPVPSTAAAGDGDAVDYSQDPAHRIVAPAGSDDIVGPDHPATVYTNNGALDILRAGPADTRVIGGSGQNVIYGGSRGDDVLIGGRGANVIYAGGGSKTTLQDSAGDALMYGGKGANTFIGHDMRGVMWGGSGANTMIATGDTAGVEMTSSPGVNTYEIDGTGTPRIVQLPGPRDDSRLLTDHSLTLPPFIQTGEATGHRHVKLTGGHGTTTLIANNAGDTLIGGPGPTSMRGGAGNDTFVFNDENDDVATGGRGADRYEFTGTPESFERPAALAYPAGATAAMITDFNPAKGDRLILSAKVFGSQLLALRAHLRIVSGRDPKPTSARPTLLFNSRSGLLSFDRDGTGPISDQVIVRIAPARAISVRAIAIEP
jgi:Ca2+-binding RTX toxin-like protein